MKILLVEDEHHVRRALDKALSSHGYAVTGAESASEAVGLLQDQVFDVLVVDINLPDATGWDVLGQKSRSRNPDTPAIVMSAIPPSVKRIREFAPVGVLLKPFPVDALYRAVEQAISFREDQEPRG
jgi:DNA-binding NtrC family response regulator